MRKHRSESRRIYDSYSSKELSISKLQSLFASKGVTRLLYKLLAPNDNSKNQIYFAGHFTDLGFLPTGELIPSASSSQKTKNPKRKVKYTSSLKFSWLAPDGQSFVAPTTKLIYYPQFPEVRLSGFLARSKVEMAGWMDPAKKGRRPGRVLLMGIKGDGHIFSFLAIPGSRISNEIGQIETLKMRGAIREIPFQARPERIVKHQVMDQPGQYHQTDLFEDLSIARTEKSQARILLLNELRRIHLKGPIAGQRLNRKGEVIRYRAMNGGGYALEAELGVIPNGFSEPDFHGWEIKQFSVKRCGLTGSKPLTLMTPEPNGGLYFEQGVEAFIRTYGYRNVGDRIDFTGRHFTGITCAKSGLTLKVHGFDSENEEISEANGFIGLFDKREVVTAKWTFAKLIDHWKRKHSKAAYVPAVATTDVAGIRKYQYCNNVRLFEGTDFTKLLSAFIGGAVYYDPGINLKAASTKPKVKRRNQFRVKSSSLHILYEKGEEVDVAARS